MEKPQTYMKYFPVECRVVELVEDLAYAEGMLQTLKNVYSYNFASETTRFVEYQNSSAFQ